MLCYVIHGLNSCMANKDTTFYLPYFLFNKCSFGMINFANLYYYLAYICCYSYVSLYFFCTIHESHYTILTNFYLYL